MIKVLLVDDDGLLRNLFGKRLEHVGYEVLPAVDGKQAIEIAEEFGPDVILLDYQMPKLNGDEVMSYLRDTHWGAEIPIIIMSAITSLDEVANVDHAQKVMYKPITNRELLNAIEEVLSTSV